MAKPKKASKSKTQAKAKVAKRAVAHKSAKAKSEARPKAATKAAKTKIAKTQHAAAKPQQKKVVAKAKLPAKAHKPHKPQNLQRVSTPKVAKGAEKARVAAKGKPLSAKDQRLAKLKAIAEQMAKGKTKVAEKAPAAAAAKTVVPAAAAPAGKEPRGKKQPTRGLTAKEKALVKEFERKELRPEEAEARRVRLKNLVMLGKERSYLTYAEINDHLPDEMLDAEQLETIIGMIIDMGFEVFERAPDADNLLLSGGKPRVGD